MPSRATISTEKPGDSFTEAQAWETVAGGWQPLHGNFRQLGYSIEWHDFVTQRDLDWSRSFHPDGVEICLNLTGHGEVQAGHRSLQLTPSMAGFYAQNDSRLTAFRKGGERHQFVTIELSWSFLERYLGPGEGGLHPQVSKLFGKEGRRSRTVSDPVHLTSEQREMAMTLRHPPLFAGGHRLWYHAKALEVAAAVLYQPRPNEELFCQRQKRLNHERVQKVMAILKESLAEPPSLEEIGRRVGCSHCYLSRIFTQEMGHTISACLRDLRLDQSARLLREGRLNVTQVALEVGYSSPSHFSTAFHEKFGCCPGLYPLATPAQRAARPGRSGK